MSEACGAARSGWRIIAVAYGEADHEIRRVQLGGGNGYEFTAHMLAWGAAQALAWEARPSGVLGPVEAFGLDALEAACAEAGFVTVA